MQILRYLKKYWEIYLRKVTRYFYFVTQQHWFFYSNCCFATWCLGALSSSQPSATDLAVHTPGDAGSQEVGRRECENVSSVDSPAETEPVLNVLTCISTPLGRGDVTDGAASEMRNGLDADNSQDAAVTQFTEQITRAREGLVPASRHTAVLQPLQRATETHSETDSLWNQISLHVNQMHQLKIRDLDFSDLVSDGDSADSRLPDLHSVPETTVPNPPPPPTFMIPPPPPPPPGNSNGLLPPPPLLATATNATIKTRKTMKLHWKTAKPNVRSVFSSQATETIWTQLSREIGPVKIDCSKLEHLFETRTVDMKSKVRCTCPIASYVNLLTFTLDIISCFFVCVCLSTG